MVGNCTVMFFDPMSGRMFKTRNLLLRDRVEFLEQLIMEMRYRHDYGSISLADYLLALRLPISGADELSYVFPGYWFNVEQIGWYHGVPLVTIDMENSE